MQRGRFIISAVGQNQDETISCSRAGAYQGAMRVEERVFIDDDDIDTLVKFCIGKDNYQWSSRSVIYLDAWASLG